MQYIDCLVDKLIEKQISMIPVTKEEMHKLSYLAKANILPKAYIEFMSMMGNGTEGGYMGGDSCFMDEIGYLKLGAIELLEENSSINFLTDDDFVFWMSQGCMFCFFKLSEGDNPPVYFYTESGEDKFIKIANTMVEFWMNRLEMNPNTFKEK